MSQNTAIEDVRTLLADFKEAWKQGKRQAMVFIYRAEPPRGSVVSTPVGSGELVSIQAEKGETGFISYKLSVLVPLHKAIKQLEWAMRPRA